MSSRSFSHKKTQQLVSNINDADLMPDRDTLKPHKIMHLDSQLPIIYDTELAGV